MSNYQDTIRYWDQIFSGVQKNDPFQPIPIVELETALAWLAADAKTVLDFGCGSGRMLLRTLPLGASEVWGIDIAPAAIQRLQDLIRQYHLQERSHFACGSVEILEKMESHSIDAAILSNVVDNLMPDDAQRVLEEIHRVVRAEGKVLFKFNPYLQTAQVESDSYFHTLSTSFYREESGLYLWNLSSEELAERLHPYFSIEKSEEIDMGPAMNRLYYTRNRK